MTYYGTKSHPLFGHNESNGVDNLRATLFGVLPDDAHIYSMGFYAGYYTASDPATARGAIYDDDGDLIQYSDAVTLDDRFIQNNDGEEIDNLALQEAFTSRSGARFKLAILGYNGAFSHGQDNTGAFMYRSNRGSSTPPDPIPGTGTYETRITVWFNYEKNVKPEKPSNLTPSDNSSTTDTTPLYEGDFVDANILMPNGLVSDYMAAFQIQVRSVTAQGATNGTVVWDSGWLVSTQDERDNNRFSRSHGGSALSAGTNYQMRARVQDKLGANSDWSHGQSSAEAWQDFLVTGAGIVTLNGTPTGRTTDTTPDFQGRYHNVAGTAATHMKIQLWSGNTFIKETTEIAKAVSSSASPGTLFTITAAEANFGTLASATEYKYRIAAKSSGVYSNYSSFRTFKTNSPPNQPTNLRPQGTASSILPLLTAQTSDPDGDAITVSARIKDDGLFVMKTRAMVYDAALYSGQGGYKYQTLAGADEVQQVTITGSPTGGTFQLIFEGQTTASLARTASAADIQTALENLSNIAVGDVVCAGGPLPSAVTVTFRKNLGLSNRTQMTFNNSLSGGSSPTPVIATNTQGADGDIPTYGDYHFDVSATDGDLTSQASQDQSFTYAQGPSITVDFPTEAEVIDTNTPIIEWTVTDQVKRRVRIYDSDTETMIHDSLEATTGDNTYSVPLDVLRNGGHYYVIVEVTNSAPLTGYSAPRNFDLVYDDLAEVTGFNVAPNYAEQDVEPSVLTLGWDGIAVDSGIYLRTMIFRADAGVAYEAADKVFETTNQGTVSWTDTMPRSGRAQTYWIVYEVQMSSTETLTSPPVSVTGLIEIQATVVSDVRNGMTARVFLWSTKGRTEEPRRQQTEVHTWDGGDPWIFEGPVNYTVMTVDAYVYQTPGATVDEQLDGLRYLCGDRDDGTPVLACMRDDRSRKLFGRARGLKITDVEFKRARVAFSFTTQKFTEVLA